MYGLVRMYGLGFKAEGLELGVGGIRLESLSRPSSYRLTFGLGGPIGGSIRI